MFTLYTMGIIFFFGIVINIVFFQQRYQAENIKFQANPKPIQAMMDRRIRPVSPIETIPVSRALAQELKENTIVRRLTVLDDEYVLYARDGDVFKLVVVTRLVLAQMQLIRLFLVLMIVFAFVTYGFSLLLVRSSLHGMKKLVDYVDMLDIHSLDMPVPLQ